MCGGLERFSAPHSPGVRPAPPRLSSALCYQSFLFLISTPHPFYLGWSYVVWMSSLFLMFFEGLSFVACNLSRLVDLPFKCVNPFCGLAIRFCSFETRVIFFLVCLLGSQILVLFGNFPAVLLDVCKLHLKNPHTSFIYKNLRSPNMAHGPRIEDFISVCYIHHNPIHQDLIKVKIYCNIYIYIFIL